MNNEEKILNILVKQSKALATLQSDMELMQRGQVQLEADIKDLKQGQTQTNERLTRLENNTATKSDVQQSQTKTEKRLDVLANDMGEFFNQTWDKMDEANERITTIENHLGLRHSPTN